MLRQPLRAVKELAVAGQALKVKVVLRVEAQPGNVAFAFKLLAGKASIARPPGDTNDVVQVVGKPLEATRQGETRARMQ